MTRTMHAACVTSSLGVGLLLGFIESVTHAQAPSRRAPGSYYYVPAAPSDNSSPGSYYYPARATGSQPAANRGPAVTDASTARPSPEPYYYAAPTTTGPSAVSTYYYPSRATGGPPAANYYYYYPGATNNGERVYYLAPVAPTATPWRQFFQRASRPAPQRRAEDDDAFPYKS